MRMKTMTMTTTCLASLLLASTLNATPIVDWDFSVLGAPGDDNTAVGGDADTDNNVGVINLLGAGNANAAAGITVTDITGGTGSSDRPFYSNGNPASGEANVKQFDGEGDQTNDRFLEFTITADISGTLNIDSISINQWRNGDGAPEGIAFDVSIDGGSFSLYDAVQVDPNFGDFTFDLFTFTQSIVGAGIPLHASCSQ